MKSFSTVALASVSSTEKSYTHRLVRLVQGFYGGPPDADVQEGEIDEVPRSQHNNGRYKVAPSVSYGLGQSWAEVQYNPEEGIEADFYVQPSLLDIDRCQSLLSCLNATSRTGFAAVLKHSKLEFLIDTGDKVEMFQSQMPVNRWQWLRIQMSFVGNMFTWSVRQLNRLAEKAPAPEEGVVNTLSAPMVQGSNTLLFGAGMFEGTDRPSTKPVLLQQPSRLTYVRHHPKSTTGVALVLSTFIYLPYANERMFDVSRSSAMQTSDGVSIAADHEYYKNLDRRLDLGLSAYNVHRDGSPTAYPSALRPILNLRPNHIHCALDRPREFSADLLMIGFLERSGIPYDIITDHCLHERGSAVMAQYETIYELSPGVPLRSNPQCAERVAKANGNFMYLGNGFY